MIDIISIENGDELRQRSNDTKKLHEELPTYRSPKQYVITAICSVLLFINLFSFIVFINFYFNSIIIS